MDGDLDTGAVGSGTESQGGNPAWNDVLSVIPQELHEKVTPHFQQWDKGVQDRFQKVHSEYEPWKPVIKSGADPETTQFALNLVTAIEQSPELVYKAIGDMMKANGKTLDDLGAGPGEPKNKPDGDTDKPWQSDLQQIQQHQEMLARNLIADRKSREHALADQKLDEELAQLKGKHGEFDENYVLGLIISNPQMSTEDAVTAWQNSIRTYSEKLGYTPKPFFVGGGGNVPGQNVDVKKLDDRGTKDLVVKMLEQAAMQNKQ